MPYLCLIVSFISDRDLFYCIAVHATHYKKSQLSCSHKNLTTHESKTSLRWFNLIKLSSIALNTGTFEGPPTRLPSSLTTFSKVLLLFHSFFLPFSFSSLSLSRYICRLGSREEGRKRYHRLTNSIFPLAENCSGCFCASCTLPGHQRRRGLRRPRHFPRIKCHAIRHVVSPQNFLSRSSIPLLRIPSHPDMAVAYYFRNSLAN